MRVEQVYHRDRADLAVHRRRPAAAGRHDVRPVHPRTGRPGHSQARFPGVHAVHAVDAAGVHPLLLAIGSERYVPYEDRRRPRELLTLANAILGHGQLSLAKYLFIAAGEDNPELDVHDVARLPPPRARAGRLAARPALPDLHHDRHARLHGRGPERRLEARDRRGRPAAADPAGGHRQPHHARRRTWASAIRGSCLPGILVVEGPPFRPGADGRDRAVERFCARYSRRDAINDFPLVVVVDDSEFAARTLNNFLWTTFTRSNPAADIYGIDAVRARQALGLPRLAGDRRPRQAAPRRRRWSKTPRSPAASTPWPPAGGRCTGSSDAGVRKGEREKRGEKGREGLTLVPTLCVGTHSRDALRRPVRRGASRRAGSHAERGNQRQEILHP